MEFAQPDRFVYFALIPVLVLLGAVFAKIQKQRFKRAFQPKLWPFLTATVSTRKRQLKLILQCVTLALLVVAWARPRVGSSGQAVKSVGLEMIVAFDVSTSMLAEDVKPSRLEFAKSEIGRLLDQLGGDKVGIVAFAGSAFLLSPLTSDKSALKMFMESLTTEAVTTQGTHVSAALQEAAAAFERGGVESDERLRVAHVVLVASDGEDHEQGAIDLARKLLSQGVRVFTLGFGTEKGAPIPQRDERGHLAGYKKDPEGQVILSTAKGTFLQNLAQAGGGSFYHATFGGRATSQLNADFDRLEKAEFETSTSLLFDEKYQIFLLAAIVLAFAEMLLGERKSKGRIWRGRFEVEA